VVSGASGQVRNVATVAGNLLQRPRCVYYRNVAMPCNRRRPGAGCAARDGYQRQHAILGAPDACIATHPSDMAVALAALDGVVRTETPAGERAVPLVEFYCPPGDEPDRDTVLERDELIVAVDVPPSAVAARSSYRKIRDRASFAFALVSVAAALRVEEGRVRDVRLAFGGVAHRPWRATVAEHQLCDEPATERNFGRALDAELAAARPLPGNAFKVELARSAALRSLLDLMTKETP
jgi:xanthine dehydrogenase YagS FAD-binding subunit